MALMTKEKKGAVAKIAAEEIPVETGQRPLHRQRRAGGIPAADNLGQIRQVLRRQLLELRHRQRHAALHQQRHAPLHQQHHAALHQRHPAALHQRHPAALPRQHRPAAHLQRRAHNRRQPPGSHHRLPLRLCRSPPKEMQDNRRDHVVMARGDEMATDNVIRRIAPR